MRRIVDIYSNVSERPNRPTSTPIHRQSHARHPLLTHSLNIGPKILAKLCGVVTRVVLAGQYLPQSLCVHAQVDVEVGAIAPGNSILI